jgi:hypothetical protein
MPEMRDASLADDQTASFDTPQRTELSASPFRDCRDVIYAEPSIIMKAGHHCHVRFNHDS